MLKIEPKKGILDIALYQAGSSPRPAEQNVIKLSSNENPYGPSKKSIDAITRHAAGVHLYPSTNHLELRQSIAARFGLSDENIICGVGSDEIISFLCQAFAGPGDEVIVSPFTMASSCCLNSEPVIYSYKRLILSFLPLFTSV